VISGIRPRRPFVEIPLPTQFEDPPGDRDIDLVVLGDSSALGVPFERWLSIGDIVKWKLAEAIPGRTVRLHQLASMAHTLEQQHHQLKSLRRRPEVLLIYCGLTDVCLRGPETRRTGYYFDEFLPRTTDVFIAWIEQISPVCALFHQYQDECRSVIPPASGGVRALVDAPAYTETEFVTELVGLRHRLETIVAYAEAVGALPILIAAAGNDAGLEPNRSFLPASTPRTEREAVARDFREAQRTEASDPDRAIARFRALLSRHPRFAEAHYRLAKLLDGKGQWDEAYRHYIVARDSDGLPVRFLTLLQNLYHEVAAGHDCILIDMQSYFHRIGRHGLLDDELFQDAMHPSLRGQIALAQAVLQTLHARQALGYHRDSPVPFVDPAECARHFDFKPDSWRFLCIWGMMMADRADQWRHDPPSHLRKRVLYANAADRVEAGATPESLGLPNIGLPAPIPVDLSAPPNPPAAPDHGSTAPPHFDVFDGRLSR
jgi:hypothetical protein